MAYFEYKGRNARGVMVTGRLESPSADSVASQLLNGGVTPVEIKEAKKPSRQVSLLTQLNNRSVGLDDLILFSRQMYTLMKAGIPMMRAMTGLIQSTRNQRMVEALKEILSLIESGRDLSSSLSRHPDIFTTLFVSMVRVGEETGRLDESFLRVSMYLEREKETRERIKAALRYPLFVIIAIAVAIAIINIWVIPAFVTLFNSSNVELPWQTKLLIGTSDFMVEWWPVLLVGIIGLVVGFNSYIKTEKGRYWWDEKKLKIPLAGSIIRRATLARFSRAFAMSLSSGVPLIQALTVVSRSVDNEFIGEHILNMRNGIERGESLTRTATLSGMFTPLVLQMLAVGEETGGVDELLGEVADYYEREVDYDIKGLSAAIEPILIVAIGIMVLILALGVFLPMWDLISVFKG